MLCQDVGMLNRVENTKWGMRPVRPAVLLFAAALAVIFALTLDLYTIPLLIIIIGVFFWRGWHGGLDRRIMLAFILALFILSAPVFREFKLEQRKVEELSAKATIWRGRIIIPAVSGDSEWSEAVLRLDTGPLVAVRGKPKYLRAGNVIESGTLLEIPSGQRNPGGFDRQAQLRGQGVFLEAFLGQAPEIKESRTSPLSLWRNFTADLQGSAFRFFQRTLDSDIAGLAAAICLGNTDGITPAENYAFKESGLIHLVSVSGAHLGFVLIPLKQIKTINKRSKDYLTLVLLIAFGIITGWRTGVSRACLMILLRKYARHRELALDEMSLLAITGLILLLNPFRALQRGYWLSLAATGGIRLGVSPLLSWLGVSSESDSRKFTTPPLSARENSGSLPGYKIKRRIRHFFGSFVSRVFQLLAITCCAQLACILPSLYWQNGFNPLSLIVNVIAGIPAVLITAGGISGLFLLAPLNFILPAVSSPLLVIWRFVLRQAVNVLRSLAESCSGAGGGFVGSGEMGFAGRIIILLSALCLGLALVRLRPAYVLRRLLKLTLLFVFLISFIGRSGPKGSEIWFLDVGQGDSCLLRVADKTVLIDGGERDQGYYTIMPFLRSQGIARIDTAIVTHGHSDHCGGIMDLLEQGMISGVIMPGTGSRDLAADNSSYVEEDLTQELISLALQKEVPVSYRCAGDKVVSGGGLLALDYLAPDRTEDDKLRKYLPADLNRDSIVIHGQLMWLRLLFTADATLEIEDYLVREHQENLKAQVLKVSHHGSKYASSDSFLARVKPQIAIISTGYNRFGHPAEDTLTRLEKAGCQEVLRTDEKGAVRLQVEEKKVRISTWRDKKSTWIIQH